MTPSAEIKAALKAHNTNMAALARHLGLSYSVVERAINGYGRNARVEAEIERLMGRKVFPPKKKPGVRKSTWPVGAHSTAQAA